MTGLYSADGSREAAAAICRCARNRRGSIRRSAPDWWTACYVDSGDPRCNSALTCSCHSSLLVSFPFSCAQDAWPRLCDKEVTDCHAVTARPPPYLFHRGRIPATKNRARHSLRSPSHRIPSLLRTRSLALPHTTHTIVRLLHVALIPVTLVSTTRTVSSSSPWVAKAKPKRASRSSRSLSPSWRATTMSAPML